MLTIKASKLKQMFMSGADAVAKEYEYINELNVFPVPDGDTGTNMMITINGAVDAIRNIDYTDISLLGKHFSRGLLMNARGNSGVIFSQIIKGFTSVLKENKNEIGVVDFVDAFIAAKNVGYAAVASPSEGTILTVIRVTAEKLSKERNFKTIEDVMKMACREAHKILLQTPELLRELKEAGVVDSGGYGLCCFFDGMLSTLIQNVKQGTVEKIPLNKIRTKKSFIDKLEDPNVGFGYCCEFIMTLKSRVSLKQPHKKKFDLIQFKKEMSKIGDSLAVIRDSDIVKVHVHTLFPYRVLEAGTKYGEFNKVKIENMTLQFIERNPGTTLENLQEKINTKRKLPSDVKIIATVPSANIASIYKNQLNIAHTINTEVLGNPSIQEFLDKIRKAHSSNVIIVVDDSNVVLAANEAASLVTNEVNIKIINARNIVASYLACLSFDPIKDLHNNYKIIEKIIDSTVVGKTSISTKFVKYSHIEIQKNDFIGIMDKKIVVSDKSLTNVLQELSNKLVDEIRKPKLAYIVYGKDAQLRDIKFLKKHLMETHSLKVTVLNGSQPTYSFYIAIQ
ncbi:MAG: DAK2 domain-containing protein [Mycoplasmataceae bacterium]|jgi:DAK2 domain fusion protein YloV|nr:DAK2 domain-containing protein [Mycoplasmataceae bacterium]